MGNYGLFLRNDQKKKCKRKEKALENRKDSKDYIFVINKLEC